MNEKPKRPMSAYLMWLNSAREQIKSERPGLRVTEVARRGGELWRAMEDKSEWERKAASAKEQYARQLESYVASGGPAPAAPAPAKRRGPRAPPAAARPAKRGKGKGEDAPGAGDTE